ncbi:MAG: nucleotide-binding protein [Betaproteobacteria bacterium]
MKPVVLLAAALMAAGLAAQAAPTTLKGEVLEVQNVEGYTYVRAKTKEGEIWAAVPSAPLKKGQQVTFHEPMVMTNFESKALKRKFDRIVFATLDESGAKQAADAAAPANPHASAGAAAAAAPVGKIAKATGADGKTVEEVFANKAALKDKTVSIRGQVVKVNSGILGKNWLHLQDGSGAAAKGTHDIIVTTTDEAKVGDVVLASGTVKTDVNVGSGYAYAVLVDQAKLRR